MNCGSDILKGYSDQSVYWSSSSVPEIGIDEFMKYSNVIKIIIDSYLEYKNAKFDLGCLIDGKCGNCDSITGRDETIKSLLHKICSLTSDDIDVTGLNYSSRRLSKNSIELIGSNYSYQVSNVDNMTMIDFNLKENQPNNISSTRIVVYGKSETGKNIILDSPEKITSIKVSNESYPLNIDIIVRVDTNGGVVDLLSNFTLNNPTEVGIFKKVYDVRDRTLSDKFSGKMSDWIGSFEATQQRIDEYYERLRYGSNGDAVDILNRHNFEISSNAKRVEELNNIQISLQDKSGLVTTKYTNIQNAITSLTEMTNALLDDNKNLKDELKAVQNKVSNISNPSGGGIDGTTNNGNTSLSTSVV